MLLHKQDNSGTIIIVQQKVVSALKKTNNETVIGIGFVVIILAGAMSLFVDDLSVLRLLLVGIGLGALIMLYGYVGLRSERKRGQDKAYSNLQLFRNEYEAYAYELGVVRSNIQATLFEGSAKVPHYMWIAGGALNMFPVGEYFENQISAFSRPDVANIKLKKISVDDILYFEELGELRKYVKTTGGGSSLKGALVGYVLAGDVGAIIGSREPVRTNIVSEDERKVELIYKNADGEIENLEFAHDAYSMLKALIPDKELRRMKNLK